MVSVDLYLNETTRHAHVILPALSPLEQPHWDVWAWPFSLTSGGHYSPTLFDPHTDDPDRPDDWRMLARLGAIVGGEPQADLDALDDAYFGAMCDQVGVPRQTAFEALPQHGAQRILDLCIRSGPLGDGFGSRPGGLTLQAFIDQPDGIVLGSAGPQGAAAIKTPSGRIELAHPHLLADLQRLDAAIAADEAASRIDGNAANNTAGPAPLVLVSRRHLRSLNSWMHNVEGLVSGKPRCTLQMHPQDAAQRGLQAGDLAEVRSASGSVKVPTELTDNIRPGVVCLPHGWGHGGPGTRTAVSAQHAGINEPRHAGGRSLRQRGAQRHPGDRGAGGRRSSEGPMNRLKNKVACITGAGSGIGRASALRFAAEGVKVLVTDLRGDTAAAAAAEITAAGGLAEAMAVDVGDQAQLTAMIERTVQRFGRIDILYNNAVDTSGQGQADTDFLAFDPERFYQIVRVNVLGGVLASKLAIPHMLGQGGGAILFTSSTSSLGGDVAQFSYGGSKAMLNWYVQTIVATFGKQGIRCNAILPGVIETPAMKAWANPAMTAAFLDLQNVPRLGQPEDIAALATFLASDEAAYINGARMRADGGMICAVPHVQVVRHLLKPGA